MSANNYIITESQSLVSELDINLLIQNVSTSLTPPEDKPMSIWYYALHQYWRNEGFPNVEHLPLLESGPVPVLVIMSAYLLFVLRIGPWIMSKRPAFELKLPMLIYNALMVIFNAYFFYKFISYSDYGRVFLNFQFPNKYDNSPKAQAVIWTSYLYFLTKFVDLLDTIFFVLRKRNRQISGLHLYHHTVVPLLGWLTMKLMATVPAFQIFGILNSLVHTIMYSYYALSAFGPSIQPYLWWKRYITQIQITQFVILIGYSLLLGIFQTGYPATWFWVGFIQSPLFFYMFTDFYIQSYRKSKAKSKVALN